MQKSFSSRGQKGFTLIELVVVIVILGILAATALPRFLNAATSARASALQGLQGSVNSAIAITHAQYLIAGGNPTSVTLDGGTVVTMWGGYPDTATTGIAAAISYTANPITSNSGFFFTAVTPATASGPATFQANGAATPANCAVSYTGAAAPAANGAATAAPIVTIDVTKC